MKRGSKCYLARWHLEMPTAGKKSQRPWLVTPRWGWQSQSLYSPWQECPRWPMKAVLVLQETESGKDRQQTSVIQPDEPRENGNGPLLNHLPPPRTFSSSRQKSGWEQHKQAGHSCLSLRTPHMEACPTLTLQIPQQDWVGWTQSGNRFSPTHSIWFPRMVNLCANLVEPR